MSVVNELRQNNPEPTDIEIHLHLETSDADLAQALEQNPFVTEIILDVEGEQRLDWNYLLDVIAMRANLEKVELWDGRRTAPALVRSILRAVQQNAAIRTVELSWLYLPMNISTFVDNASSITSFILDDCGGEQGARDGLAASLQRNTNIETLKLDSLKEICAIPILEGLRFNVFLKTFIFSPRNHISLELSDATSQALQHLFESTTSIQEVEFDSTAFSERRFPLIAQAITSSECVSKLKFDHCRFEDQSRIAQLRSILQNKRNLTSLCLDGCHFRGELVHEAILSTFSRPDSSLRCFEICHGSFDDLEQLIPDIQFKNLLQAIQVSKLERLAIGWIETPHHFQTLTESIPSMHIRDLEIYVKDPVFWDPEGSDDEEGEEEGEFTRETIRQDLLHAVKNNFSLRAVEADMPSGDERDLFERAEDKHRLAFYANRNESLDQWVDNPVTVEQRKVWPEALGLAERAGPSVLFRGLRSVLESDYVKLPAGRKHKHPQLSVLS